MIYKNYINNISGLQGFQLLRFGTLLLISIAFAKSNLPTASIGNYEVFLFVTTLFCSFWINGLIQSFLPVYKNNNTFKTRSNKSPEIFNAFVLLSFLSILAILVLVVFKQPLSGVLTDTGAIPYFQFILLFIFFSSPSFLIEYIYLLKNKPGSILIYGITTFTVQLIVVALPALLGYSMEISIWGMVAISVVRYIWLLILLNKYSQWYFSADFLKEHIHFAYPLIISTLLGSSAGYVDSFLVLHQFDSATFAIFRYGAREFPLVLLMANALSTAMIPEFSNPEKFRDTLFSLRKKTMKLMHLLFPVTIVFLIFSNWLYPRIFNPDFTESAVIFNIYLLLIISRLLFPHTILIGLKKTKMIMYASLAELIINIILSILFISFWGIEGVAFATIIAFAVQKIIWLAYNKKVLRISAGDYIPLKTLALYSLITLVVFFIVY